MGHTKSGGFHILFLHSNHSTSKSKGEKIMFNFVVQISVFSWGSEGYLEKPLRYWKRNLSLPTGSAAEHPWIFKESMEFLKNEIAYRHRSSYLEQWRMERPSRDVNRCFDAYREAQRPVAQKPGYYNDPSASTRANQPHSYANPLGHCWVGQCMILGGGMSGMGPLSIEGLFIPQHW